MNVDRGERIVATAIRGSASPLETVLFGTDDATEIVGLLAAFCGRSLDVGLRTVTFYKRSVGVVFGVLLNNDQRVVIKVHRPELIPDGLDGIRAVQSHLAERGLPAPKPLGGPLSLGHGIAAAEEMMDREGTSDVHDPYLRRVLVAGLCDFMEAATPMLGDVRLPLVHPFDLPDGQLWPMPHDVRFDLSLPGAEWVDELALRARSALHRYAGGMVVAHADWRIENVRLDRSGITAIYDWDSVCATPEAASVGANSATFTANWDDGPTDPYPSIEEMDAFVNEFEQTRGSAFTKEEREAAGAARIYTLAYSARCEHSDPVKNLLPQDPDRGWSALLRSMA